jgi:hypothetical protein
MGANEPFAGMDRGRAPKLLRNFVPYVLLRSRGRIARKRRDRLTVWGLRLLPVSSGYDIYLLGVQEGVSEGPLEAIESLLGMEG